MTSDVWVAFLVVFLALLVVFWNRVSDGRGRRTSTEV